MNECEGETKHNCIGVLVVTCIVWLKDMISTLGFVLKYLTRELYVLRVLVAVRSGEYHLHELIDGFALDVGDGACRRRRNRVGACVTAIRRRPSTCHAMWIIIHGSAHDLHLPQGVGPTSTPVAGITRTGKGTQAHKEAKRLQERTRQYCRRCVPDGMSAAYLVGFMAHLSSPRGGTAGQLFFEE